MTLLKATIAALGLLASASITTAAQESYGPDRADYGQPSYVEYFRYQLTDLMTQYGKNNTLHPHN